MGSDSRFTEFPGSNKFEDETVFPVSNQYHHVTNGFKLEDSDFDFVENPLVLPDSDPGNSAMSSITSIDEDSPSDDNDSENLLKYINQMLMEEDMEEKPCMFHDPLALQAAERSFYDILGEKNQPSLLHGSSYGDQFLVDSPDDGFRSSRSDYSSNKSSFSNSVSSVDPQGNGEFGEIKPLFMQMPLPNNFVFQSAANLSSDSFFKLLDGFGSNDDSATKPSAGNIVAPNLFHDTDLALQFKRGVEEASKFLPKGNPLIIDLESNALSPEMNRNAPKVAVKAEKEDREYSPEWLTGKKNHEREDGDFEEERSNKQSAVHVDESELSEMFDTLVGVGEGCRTPRCILDQAEQCESSKTVRQNRQTKGSSVSKTRAKRRGDNKEVVDLRTLLIQCAQAVSSNDRRTANELLKQIRQHSSPLGDGSQRMAHCFANGFEARMAGTGTQIYTALSTEKWLAVDMLKAYQAYVSACPFKKMAIIFANHNILKVAEKASTLHIIDFGILYGFQWPPLIYRLSRRPGGPPKLRITGIELPQSGFRPAERVQETGRRLAKYCERYNVPFEYNAIAQKWDTIQIDDLKINRDEVLAVNCLFRFKNLLDETVVVNSPRNAVLTLISKTKPDIFIHAIVNGSYNAPFFVTRFREALFHFSALFDMLDSNMPREDEMRLKFEKEFYGREAMNVIACEGSERVERPETYKQWQVRNMRAGLKQLPLGPLCNKENEVQGEG
ncbi:SCARECROW-LIKE PROTEIN 14 [Salix purpurea]|uniref:SCARECROW-LIKE PROTEIN 14 n=1 Tax=Salix purpurea TaxID=77065 RepID=A0A9Q0VV35_SALPP|nr:SCARECROW-LIKE PROTEIN 14 [Salix purpurea]